MTQEKYIFCSFIVILVMCLLSVPTPAFAEVAAHDVVRLENGAIYRGTITELVPGDHVIILLLNGESRTFTMSEVTFAGVEPQQAAPAVQASPAPSPAPAVEEQRIRVSFQANRTDLTIHRVSRSTEFAFSSGFGVVANNAYSRFRAASYEQIGVTPCETELEPGAHVFTVTLGRHRHELDSISLTQDTTLVLDYESRRTRRIAGWLTFGLGIATGMALSIAGLAQSIADINPNPKWALSAPGFVIVGVSTVVGLVLGLQRDRVHLADQNAI